MRPGLDGLRARDLRARARAACSASEVQATSSSKALQGGGSSASQALGRPDAPAGAEPSDKAWTPIDPDEGLVEHLAQGVV